MTKHSLGLACMTAMLLIALLAGVFLPAPAAALSPAQDGALDPAVLAAVQAAAVHVTEAVGAGAAAGAGEAVAPADVPADEPAVDTTEPVTPTAVVIPTVDDFQEYNSAGISILAPPQWNVKTDTPGAIFDMEEPALDLVVRVQDFGSDFPGVIIFPIFENNVQELVDSFVTDAEVTDLSRVALDEGVPGLRIGFTGLDSDGVHKGGVIYIYATGSSAIGVLGGGVFEQWAEVEPLIDEIASSVILDDAMINLEVAGSDGKVFDDPNGEFSITVPAGWYLSPVVSPDLRLVIADPDITTVGALAVASDLAADDAELKALTDAMAGGLDGDQANTIADEFVKMLELGIEDMQVDATRTAVLPSTGESLGVIRLVGTAPIQDGPAMDMTIYTSIYADKLLAMVFFGDPDAVQAEEETIIQTMDSTQFP